MRSMRHHLTHRQGRRSPARLVSVTVARARHRASQNKHKVLQLCYNADMKDKRAYDYYKTGNGRKPVQEFLKALSKPEKKALGADLRRVQDGERGMPLVRNMGQ